MFLIKTGKAAEQLTTTALERMRAVRTAADTGDRAAFNTAFEDMKDATRKGWVKTEDAMLSANGQTNYAHLRIANDALQSVNYNVAGRSLGDHFQIYGGQLPPSFDAAVVDVITAQQAIRTVLREGERPPGVLGTIWRA